MYIILTLLSNKRPLPGWMLGLDGIEIMALAAAEVACELFTLIYMSANAAHILSNL